MSKEYKDYSGSKSPFCPGRGKDGTCLPTGGPCVCVWDDTEDSQQLEAGCKLACIAYRRGKEDARAEIMAMLAGEAQEGPCSSGYAHEDAERVMTEREDGGPGPDTGREEEPDFGSYIEDGLNSLGGALRDIAVSGMAAMSSLMESAAESAKRKKVEKIKRDLTSAADAALKKVSEEIRNREKNKENGTDGD